MKTILISTLCAASILNFVFKEAKGTESLGQEKKEVVALNSADYGIKAVKEGNYKDALNIFNKILEDKNLSSEQLAQITTLSVQCLRNLNRISEFDAFIEKVIHLHSDKYQVLLASAQCYQNVPHYGNRIEEKFQRGKAYRISAEMRDRIRSIQLYLQGIEVFKKQYQNTLSTGQYVVEDGDTLSEIAKKNNVDLRYLMHLNRLTSLSILQKGQKIILPEIQTSEVISKAYRQLTALLSSTYFDMQILTDVTVLPDYSENNYSSHYQFVPVDQDGKPIFYQLPTSFEQAKNDGERWRWLISQWQKVDYVAAQKTYAQILHRYFGVQTMKYYPSLFDNEMITDESSPLAVSTLKEDETITRLGNGIRRIVLPQEFNYIKIYQDLVDKAITNKEKSDYYLELYHIFFNRDQYVKAAEYAELILKNSDAAETFREKLINGIYNCLDKKSKQNNDWIRLCQIRGNWGTLSSRKTDSVQAPKDFLFRFRNAQEVTFTIQPIDYEQFFIDLKQDLNKAELENISWSRGTLSFNNFFNHLLQKEEYQKYLGKIEDQWTVKLNPLPNHVEQTINIPAPVKKVGGYLVSAQVKDGNQTHVILWVNDTIILQKNTDGGNLYYVADALSGQPIADAEVNFFGYNMVYHKKYIIKTSEEQVKTNENGLIGINKDFFSRNKNIHNFFVSVKGKERRLAFLDLQGLWFGENYWEEMNTQMKLFFISDRPVYRPEQNVKFNIWLNNSLYEQNNEQSPYANQSYEVVILDPTGNKCYQKTLTTDSFGGITDQYLLPKLAKLGYYQILVNDRYNCGHFFVEEYKKPEFNVTIKTPEEPIKLGDKFTATVKADYYFGAPVTEGTIKLKVMRENYDISWYPPRIWDWLYGNGYWWFSPEYTWYPNWKEWGCVGPAWRSGHFSRPEIVLEKEGKIGSDGTFQIELDTNEAKKVHNDTDHQYTISAEITDLSRRTITGSGKLIAARKPFKVFAWLDRGYARSGETVKAEFMAITADKKPVKGTGEAKLYHIAYNAKGLPIETQIQTWSLDTNAQGKAELFYKVPVSGQFKLTYTVSDSKKNQITGAVLYNVIGQDFKSMNYQFNDLELICDKAEYKPGETANLMINTNQQDACILLFVHSGLGVRSTPQLFKIKGKTLIVPISIEKKNMPNFFVEVITIANNQIFRQKKEIIVPPEKRILNLEVLADKPKYIPGEMAEIKLKITDQQGQPVKSSSVITVYDKSVEYISDGANVPDIKEFFWGWRRTFYDQNLFSNLNLFFKILYPKDTKVIMSPLGIFSNLDGFENIYPIAQNGDRMVNRMTKNAAFGRPLAAPGAVAESVTMKAVAMDSVTIDAGEATAEMTTGGIENKENSSVSIRQNFADTAYWSAKIKPDENGFAVIKVPMPENLTTWKIKAWAITADANVGEGSAEIITAQNLILRLQAPRFFIENDEVVLSANIHNYLDTEQTVQAILELEGGTLGIQKDIKISDQGYLNKKITIPSQGEKRVDWRVRATKEGLATIRMKALAQGESDAMQMDFPVYVHGISKQIPYSGVIRPSENTANIELNIPQEIRPNETTFELRYSPTLAGAMVDALPYLVSYPYGSTEHTLNRFVPTIITQKVLQDLKLNLEDIKNKRANLNSQEIGDDLQRRKRWNTLSHIVGYNKDGQPIRDDSPVFSTEAVDTMVHLGVTQLQEMQCQDGGWGWFSGYGEYSFPHTTAVVVHGLQIAKNVGAKVNNEVLERGINWLKKYQEQQVLHLNNFDKKVENITTKSFADNLDAFIYMILNDANIKNNQMNDYLYRDRTHLSLYGKSLYGIALAKQKDQQKLEMILSNIEQFLIIDQENQTAYLNLGNDNCWWYWYGSEIETHAYYLKLLTLTKPQSEQASGVVKYLLNNRKNGGYWKSTRDTALCIEAFADYLRVTGEDKPDIELQIFMDEKLVKEVKISADNLFTFDNKFVLNGEKMKSGKHQLKLVKKGKGPVYFNAYLSYFTTEKMITKAGLEIKVNRQFFKLTPVDQKENVAGHHGQVVSQKVEKYQRQLLKIGDAVTSGDLIEVELTIESKNNYEYLLFEDLKAAGFEPVQQRSGYYGNGLGAYVEYRDEKVCFFLSRLPKGKHVLSYRLRAEVPGCFSALPTKGSAMYAPELKANSDEMKVEILDK